jgi:hypothetical protein
MRHFLIRRIGPSVGTTDEIGHNNRGVRERPRDLTPLHNPLRPHDCDFNKSFHSEILPQFNFQTVARSFGLILPIFILQAEFPSRNFSNNPSHAPSPLLDQDPASSAEEPPTSDPS